MTVAETVTGQGTQNAPELIPLLDQVAEAATKLRGRAIEALSAKLAPGGKIDNVALEREQHAAHGLAWIATYVEALRQIADYAKRLDGEGRFGEMEALLCRIGAAEYAVQLMGGVVMSQNEIVRLHELGVSEKDADGIYHAGIPRLDRERDSRRPAPAWSTLIKDAQAAAAANFGDTGLDETLRGHPRRDAPLLRGRGRAACS